VARLRGANRRCGGAQPTLDAMGSSIQHGGCQFGVAEYMLPIGERQIVRDKQGRWSRDASELAIGAGERWRRTMRICILDPGLRGLEGHHFDLDLRVVRALARRGHDVMVHGFISPRPELLAAAEAAGIRFCATFRVWGYYTPGTASSMEAYRAMAHHATAADLVGLPPADLWFWPTLLSYQFMAAAEQLRPIRQLGGIWSLSRTWAHAARQVAEAKAKAPIIVGAYDELLCRACRTSWPELPPIVRLPCPHDGAPNNRRPTTVHRIGFFGHQRAARGLGLLPQVVSDLLERGFEVVVQDSGHSIVRRGDNPRLIVLPFVPDFPAHIARCDLVIWPSRIQAYQQSFSGIVSECIATGVPVILPSGCLPANLAARFGAGIFFHEFSRGAILEAVDEVQQAYPAVAARARAAKTKWHAENGTDRLIDWIIDKYGGST
jgi:glycosyltransferase involved in cell wall biosynthesis